MNFCNLDMTYFLLNLISEIRVSYEAGKALHFMARAGQSGSDASFLISVNQVFVNLALSKLNPFDILTAKNTTKQTYLTLTLPYVKLYQRRMFSLMLLSLQKYKGNIIVALIVTCVRVAVLTPSVIV